MSIFSGKQYKGAMRDHKKDKQEAAKKRAADRKQMSPEEKLLIDIYRQEEQ